MVRNSAFRWHIIIPKAIHRMCDDLTGRHHWHPSFIWCGYAIIKHSWKKGSYTHMWDNKIDIDRIFVLPVRWNWHENTCDCSPTKSDHTLARLHFNAIWDRRSPKLQLRWSFPQIFRRTVASSNKELHIFLNSHWLITLNKTVHTIHIKR